MQFTQFGKDLSENVRTAYVLKGDEYQMGQALALLTALADPLEVNVYTPLDSVEDALLSVNSFPMFGERRVVVLQDITSFDESLRSALSAYCLDPMPSTVLVFYRCGWAPKEAFECDFERLKADALTSAVTDMCRDRGMSVDRRAVALLVNYCGEDMQRVEAELTKLQSYASGAQIDEAMVNAVVMPDPNYQIYAFTDQVAKGSYIGAHKVLDSLSSGNDQALFLGLIINHYRRAFYGKISGLEPQALGKLLGNAKAFTVTKAVDSVRRYSAKTLLELLRKLYRLEYDFKSGRMGAKEALDVAIAEAIERRNT